MSRAAASSFTITLSDIGRCPTRRLDAGHYWPDGACGSYADLEREYRRLKRDAVLENPACGVALARQQGCLDEMTRIAGEHGAGVA